MKTIPAIAIGGLILTLIGIFFTVALPAMTIAPPASQAAINWTDPANARILQGRQIYVREGCWYCHTQQVRRDDEGNPLLPDQKFGRASVENDYVYDAPVVLGTERQGPDLRWEGDIQPSSAWHLGHLKDPQQFSPGSIMPSFSYLSDEELNLLAEYLLALRSGQPQSVASQPTQGGGSAGGGLKMDTSLPTGDATNGEKLFTSLGCNACHSLEPNIVIVGPSLNGIGQHAGMHVSMPAYTGKAKNAEDYLKESILAPSAFVMPAFPDAMEKDFAQKLSAQDLADLIAFLMKQ